MKGNVSMIGATVIFLIGLAMPGIAADSLKIGYIEAQKVLEGSKAGKKAKADLEEYVKSRQKIIDLEEKEMKELEDKLNSQGAVLSPEAKRTVQEEFQRKLLLYQKKVADLNKEVQTKKAEVLGRFNRCLEQIAKKVAEKEGYAIILDKDPEGGAIIYGEESMNLTEKVISEYDNEKTCQ